MKYAFLSVVYGGFFGAIALAVWVLDSGWPLLALLLMPEFKSER